MNRATSSIILTAILLLLPSSHSAAQERFILAVMDIQDNSGKLESSDVRTANDFLRGLLLKSGRFDVVDKSRHEAKRREVIEELRRESGDSCYDERCRIQLGRELAADTLLECTIGAMGTTCTFTCELIPLEKGTAESSGVAEFICGAKGLVGAVRTVSSQLTGADVDSVGSPPQRGAFVERNFGEEASSWQPIADVGVVTAFESQPDGATVVVDGQVQCQSTPCSRTLVRGRHHVSMLRENYVKVSRQIDVTPESRRIEFKLEPDFGWLTIQCAVPGVQVEMDGQPIGKTPLANYPAARGGHRIVLKDPRFLLRGKDVQIERGENEVVELEAVPRRGGLRIVATDSDGNDLAAQAFVDGYDLGVTPVVAKTGIGFHQVVVKYKGQEWKNEATVSEDETIDVRAQFSLRQITSPSTSRGLERSWSYSPNVVAASPKSSVSAWPWVTLAGTIGLAGGGGVLWAMGDAKLDELAAGRTQGMTQSAARLLEDDANLMQGMAIGSWMAGGLTAVVTILLVATPDDNEREAMRVVPSFMPSRAGTVFGLGGVF